MASKASEEGSPARAALARSLTLNKKQSWFGSIKSAVHQGALSAKAAVESLRGGAANNTSLVDTESTRKSTHTPPARLRTTQIGCDESPSSPKPAVASLRQYLNHRSRNSRRGSVSEVFRRSGSNASSLRGAQGPEAFVRNSQDVDRNMSRLGKEDDTGKDLAVSVPLPSSPINIPPPTPTLRLDLGPSGLNIACELAEIKALQDPRNITTGVPTSHPLGWGYENPLSDPGRRDSAIAEHSLRNLDNRDLSFDISQRKSPQTSAGATDEPKPRIWSTVSTTSRPEAADPTQKPSEVETAHSTASSGRHGHGLIGPRPYVGKPLRTPENAVKPAKEKFRLPAPLFALGPQSCESTRKDSNTCEMAIDAKQQINEPREDTFEATVGANSAREIYADALLSSPMMELDVEITQHVAQNLFKGGPGVAPPYDNRSESNLTQAVLSTSSSRDLGTTTSVDVLAADGTHTLANGAHGKPCNDSLSEEASRERVPQHIEHHGLPSPTRSLQLPLRPKTLLTKHSSYESMVFRPFLDRVAAKRLGVFRPGSDQTLRQRYFPHVPIGSITAVESSRQSSLDSVSSETSRQQGCSEDSVSGNCTCIFERAVECPFPLHIRKQSGAELWRESASAPSPGNPTSPHTADSSPSRTPSMGDRQLFEMQRAERNARYNAIHSGSFDAVVDFDSDLNLADFSNAGPGSRESTPKHDHAKDRDAQVSPTRAQRVVPALPAVGHEIRARKGMSMALSRD